MRPVDRFIARVSRRAPDFQIGGSENPYCNRWWVIPRNRWFNIYLHQFVRDDDDRALHCHPWPNCSIPLREGYAEVLFERFPQAGRPLPALRRKFRLPGRITFRRAHTPHRVELYRDWIGNIRPAWSLFFTGPTLRSWGFWCPSGRWVHWRDFTAGANGEMVGAGCGDVHRYGSQNGGSAG